jgi:GNAT superfamily N-acetyltransferase
MPDLVRPDTPELWATARRLVEEYAASLPVDLAFQDFDHEVGALPDEYGPPGGAFLLALRDRLPLGCVGVRRLTADDCEMKRLYVAPMGRRSGLGRRLAQAAIAEGRRLGYRRMLLDTMPTMSEAHSLHRSLGFRPARPYRFNPVPGATFLELHLTGAAPP